MLFNKVKQDMIDAMKSGRKTDKEILSLLLGQLKNKAIDLKISELSDDDVLNIIRKMVKQLDEEILAYKNAGRVETYQKLESQKTLISRYLPKQLSDDEIKGIIMSLDDRSVPSVMRYFKLNYSGKCDMSAVNKVLRGL